MPIDGLLAQRGGSMNMYSETSIYVRRIPGVDVRVHMFDAVDSTMNRAVDLVRRGCAPWTLVTAASQTQGRGTHGRKWVSSKGAGLYFSLVLPPPSDVEHIEGLTVVTARVLVEVLSACCGLTADIKHPNDVLVRGKKIAGILFESVSSGNTLTHLILGLGLNLDRTSRELEADGLPDATSIANETGDIPDSIVIIEAFLERFIQVYSAMTGNTGACARGFDDNAERR